MLIIEIIVKASILFKLKDMVITFFSYSCKHIAFVTELDFAKKALLAKILTFPSSFL